VRASPAGSGRGAQGVGVGQDEAAGALGAAQREIVDGEGRIVTRASHSAFGVWRWSQSTTDVAVPFRFPGQLEDAETGLLYNRYRTYDPETGRFLTPDPIGLDGGLNLYGYGPNPVAWIDPMGWRHHMTVTRAPRGFNAAHASARTPGGPQYQSGMHNCPGGPPASENLQSRARCHTEQKFAHDLIQSGQRYRGQEFTLSGELPPCPNCHRALQQAADRSGANIQYQWTGPDADRRP
jgi:RHS repeat-associated protein